MDWIFQVDFCFALMQAAAQVPETPSLLWGAGLVSHTDFEFHFQLSGCYYMWL